MPAFYETVDDCPNASGVSAGRRVVVAARSVAAEYFRTALSVNV